jgi:hypothetical protein
LLKGRVSFGLFPAIKELYRSSITKNARVSGRKSQANGTTGFTRNAALADLFVTKIALLTQNPE